MAFAVQDAEIVLRPCVLLVRRQPVPTRCLRVILRDPAAVAVQAPEFDLIRDISFLLCVSAPADDLAAGLKAEANGDYATAFKKLLPLAWRGNALFEGYRPVLRWSFDMSASTRSVSG
jgi:hypothetical protein